jgi:hypothetical protein
MVMDSNQKVQVIDLDGSRIFEESTDFISIRKTILEMRVDHKIIGNHLYVEDYLE